MIGIIGWMRRTLLDTYFYYSLYLTCLQNASFKVLKAAPQAEKKPRYKRAAHQVRRSFVSL